VIPPTRVCLAMVATLTVVSSGTGVERKRMRGTHSILASITLQMILAVSGRKILVAA